MEMGHLSETLYEGKAPVQAESKLSLCALSGDHFCMSNLS
jgi:hypothetical protein